MVNYVFMVCVMLTVRYARDAGGCRRLSVERPVVSLFEHEGPDAELPVALRAVEDELEPHSGTVKWFDATRGFGFLVGDGDSGDILIHFSVLRDHGRRSLPEGARVECLAARRDRGLQARQIISFDLSHGDGPRP